MLRYLSIRNFAIIESLDMNFYSGFNVLTGETGAGKSILMDALNLILGGRAGSEMVRGGSEKAIIDAVFDMEDNDDLTQLIQDMGFTLEEDRLLVSREVALSGKSTCRIAGRPAAVSQLKEIGDWLVDLHGQHEHQSLLAVSKHIEMLDNWGGRPLQTLRAAAAEAFHVHQKLLTERKELETDAKERERLMDLFSYQVNEIQIAGLIPGEEESLELEYRRTSNAIRLTECALSAAEELSGGESGGGILDGLNRALRTLEEAAAMDETLNPILQSVRSAAYELDETARDLLRYPEKIESDPEQLSQLDQRMEQIRSLKRKYGDSIEEILEFGAKASVQYNLLVNASERKNNLDKAILNAKKKLESSCASLSAARRKSALQFQDVTLANLCDLGMEKTLFEVRIETMEPGAKGGDSVEFMISVNPGEPLRPLAKVASGGEISRIMLAIKSALSLQEALPTMVFDEIDSGVGGRTASAIADKMVKLSQTTQILCITHLPQLASRAENHFFIEKKIENERTKVSIRLLNTEERVEELARMLGGSQVTDAVIQHAREMLGWRS